MARRGSGRHNHYRDTSFARGELTTFYSFPPDIDKDIIEAAKWELKKGVLKVVADAKSNCPVDTGALRESIKAEGNDKETYFYISANAYRITTSKKSETGKFYYGQMVEFSPKINKPFLYPALDANREQIKANIREAVLKGMTQKYKFMRRSA